MFVCVMRPWAFAASCPGGKSYYGKVGRLLAPGEEAPDSEARGHERARALRLSIACGRGMRVQAGRAFDNINKKPDVKGEVLSEGAPHAPPRRYRKPRRAASGEAFGQMRGGALLDGHLLS